MECPMPQRDDLSRSLTAFQQDSTLVAVVELSRSSWLVAGIVPGIGRHPLKKLASDEEALLRLLQRWRDEAAGAGRTITRLAVAFEAGRDGFWLARWLRARGVEAHVIHPTSVAVSREHRRAKTDRLDTELLKRAFLGWLRGEPCSRNVLMSVPCKIEASPWRLLVGPSRVVPDGGGADEQGGTLARRYPRACRARRAAGGRGGLAARPERAAGLPPARPFPGRGCFRPRLAPAR